MQKLNYEEASSVLAALRMFQEAIESDPDSVMEMPHFVDCQPLSSKRIDELCERINFQFCDDSVPK